MAISGKDGKVYYIDDSCPNPTCTPGGFAEPAGDETCWYDQVTRFDLEERVANRKFGHDKSEGCQDVCVGTWGATITLNANIVPIDGASHQDTLHAGYVLYLKLYPYGTTGACNEPISGYAAVEAVSYTYDQETGAPISYRATLASKGPWVNIGPSATRKIGGFECLCTAD